MLSVSEARGQGALRLKPHRRLGALQRLRLASEIIAAYAQAHLLLRRLPVEDALAELRVRAQPPPPPAGEQDRGEAYRLGSAVVRTLRLLPGDTRCLLRSIVLTRLLARRGIACTLVIGARPGPGFLAHAWVEHAGTAVLDPGDGSFARLAEL